MKLIIKHKLRVLVICALLVSLSSHTQTETIDWSAESLFVTINGTDVDIVSNFTKQGSTIIWKQVNNNNITQNSIFNIVSSTNTWNMEDATGTLNYVLDLEGTEVTLNVTGTTEGIQLALIIYTDTASPNEMIFLINNLDQL
jgi:hypothetical protein